MEKYLVNIFGTLFIFTSILDAVKYGWLSSKIKQVKTTKGNSRNFVNAAILNAIVKLAYGCSIKDGYIILSSLLAIGFMVELFITMYWYFPYKYHNLKNFKRPNIFVYVWNSILPDKYGRKL